MERGQSPSISKCGAYRATFSQSAVADYELERSAATLNPIEA